ncbi:MAG: hypothetical protein AB1649_03995 [Chloroflexota bacterium]
MKRIDPRIVVGILLVLGGLLALAQAMNLLENATNLFFGGIFLFGGLLFLSLLFGGNWWAVFPGAALAGIGLTILLPESLDYAGGLVFLGSLGLAFWYVYLSNRTEMWWSLIPAGVLTTLAVVSVLPDRIGGVETGGVFLLGLAATFLLLALLAQMRWAYWPASVLGIVGAITFISQTDLSSYVWALILIGVGGVLLFRYFTNR